MLVRLFERISEVLGSEDPSLVDESRDILKGYKLRAKKLGVSTREYFEALDEAAESQLVDRILSERSSENDKRAQAEADLAQKKSEADEKARQASLAKEAKAKAKEAASKAKAAVKEVSDGEGD